MPHNENTRSVFCANCFGIASIIAAIGFTAQSIQSAHGSRPILDHSNFPYDSFTGSISNGSTVTLLTVPAGQVFIVTGGNSDGPYCDLYQDTTQVLEGNSQAFDSEGGLLNQGNGHLQISSASSLIIRASGSTCTYYLEGYHATQ